MKKTRVFRLMAGILGVALAVQNLTFTLVASETDSTVEQETADYYYEPTQAELAAKWKELGINLSYKDSYAKKPNPADGGELTSGTLENALKMINFIRYTAGVASDVELNEDYTYHAQAAAYVDATINVLTHEPGTLYPDGVSGISDELWAAGKSGAKQSNLGMGYAGLPAAIQGWMCDSDSSNIQMVGHRCHIIKPDLAAVGFGSAQVKGAPYQALRIDYNRRKGDLTDEYICWPAKNMPVELYDAGYDKNYAFSVGLGTSYDTPDLDNLKVTVTSKKMGKTWVLTKESDNPNGLYLTVSSQSYSWKIKNWIIFNTTMFQNGDRVSVKIEGLTKGGEACEPISYDVNFFSVSNYVQKVEKINIVSDLKGNEVHVGTQTQFSAEVLPEDATNKKVTWKAVAAKEDGGAGTITADGLFTATKVGKMTITATAKDGSDVAASVDIMILPEKKPELTLEFSDPLPFYTGKAIELSQIVNLSAVWYDEETDEYVSVDTSKADLKVYSDKECKKPVAEIRNTGLYWVRATLSGTEDYSSCQTTGYVIVQSAPLTDQSVKITGISGEGYRYTGKAIRPEITVQFGDMALEKDKDYTITWRNNVSSGEAMMIVNGKGNFTGRVVKTFQILP